jgi:hypothetical protein
LSGKIQQTSKQNNQKQVDVGEDTSNPYKPLFLSVNLIAEKQNKMENEYKLTIEPVKSCYLLQFNMYGWGSIDRVISAIKVVRKFTSLGLGSAKDLVEGGVSKCYFRGEWEGSNFQRELNAVANGHYRLVPCVDPVTTVI